MATELKIRTATPDDAAELLSIYAPYVRETAITFEVEVPTLEEFRGRIAGTLDRYPYFVAEASSQILGYAYTGAFKGRAAYDWSAETSIYVRTDVRRLGIGAELYRALEEASQKQGITNLYACIATPHSQTDPHLDWDSVRFHDREGYKLVGTFHACANKFNRWYDMVWMEKFIGPHDEVIGEVKPFPEISNGTQYFGL